MEVQEPEGYLEQERFIANGAGKLFKPQTNMKLHVA